MTLREAHHVVHFQPRPALVDCDYAATGGKAAQLKSLHRLVRTSSLFQDGTGFARSGRARRCASDFQVRPTDCRDLIPAMSVRVLSSSGVCSCELCTADRSRGRPELTDRLRGERCRIQNINKISEQARTNLSNGSRASTASASTFVISRLWPSRKRRKRTSPFSLASRAAQPGAGSLTTTNLLRKCSASS